MKDFFKQLFCRHIGIETTTKTLSTEPMFIVSTLIQCINCKKTFAQHPNANCCYVQHLHSEIMRDFYINKLKNMQQENNTKDIAVEVIGKYSNTINNLKDK